MDLTEITAPVFNIQTYCIHDGPGIRTTVFVKGCPLRCLWCANPESNEAKPQLLTYRDRCTGCGACAAVCPRGAVWMTETAGRRFAVTERVRCTGCGACAVVCPASAREIAGRRMSAAECLARILQDKLFLVGSGGGATISGGEMLVYPAFTSALLAACQENGLHTAVESASFGSREAVDRIYPYVNLALLDIKHMDSDRHRALTGVPNRPILENIRYIYRELHVPVQIRIPVVPGYNADLENIRATARFAASLGPDVTMALLPYHRLGISKAESLGGRMADDISVPDDAFMEERRAVAASFGIAVKIGG